RPPDVLSGERRERYVRPDHRLAAEGAADKVRQHPDLGRRQAEQRRDGQLDRLNALARVVQGQLVAVPDRGGGQWFDRVVMVGGKAEMRVDAQIRGRERFLDVPAPGLTRDEAAEDLLWDVGVVAALIDRRDGRRLRVADLD